LAPALFWRRGSAAGTAATPATKYASLPGPGDVDQGVEMASARRIIILDDQVPDRGID
jgi:hypothetical protein